MKILYFSAVSDLLVDTDSKKAIAFKAEQFNYMKVATDNHAEAIVKVENGDLNQLELIAVNNGYALEVMKPQAPTDNAPEAPAEEAK